MPSLGLNNIKLKIIDKMNKVVEVSNETQKPKLIISDVRYSCDKNTGERLDGKYDIRDVIKHCNENGYYIGEYWFPSKNAK